MKTASWLLGIILSVGIFTSEVEGQGLFTGGIDTTYRLTRQKTGDSVIQEFSRSDSYMGNATGFIFDRRLLTFALAMNLSREGSDSNSSGQQSENNSRNLSLNSSLNILPASRFPLSLYFGRGQSKSNQDANSPGGINTDSQAHNQNYGFSLGMREVGWLPRGSLSFNRYSDWQEGAESRENLRDSLRLELSKRKEWRGNSLSMDYNFYQTNERTEDSTSGFHSLNLRDFIQLGSGTMISLGSSLSHAETEGNQMDTYGGNLQLTHTFDPTFNTSAALNFLHNSTEKEKNSTFSASLSANKRKEFSSKLFLSGFVGGYLTHSGQGHQTNEFMNLNLSSRNIPYVETLLNYSLNLGQAQEEKSNLSNTFSLALSTYAWQRLTLDGSFTLSLSSGGQDTTRLAYNFGLRTLVWRGLSWTSRVNWNNYETRRSLEEKDPLRLTEEPGGRKNPPSSVNGPFSPFDLRREAARAFSWSNTIQFQPAYWISSNFSYELYQSEEKNNQQDPHHNSFRGTLRLWPPFLPRLQLFLDFYQNESKETGETRSGWRGTAEFLRGRTTFALDFNFNDSESSRQNDTSEGIFFKIRRPVERQLW